MKVLLLQSDALGCSALPALVHELFDNVETLATNDPVRLLVRLDKAHDFDLLIVEYHLAHAFWFVMTMETASTTLSSRVVVWSAVPSQSELMRTFQNGGRAYLSGPAQDSVTRAALQMVMAGSRYFPHELLVESPVDERDAAFSRASLTPRQSEVLALMSAGKSNKEIARDLGMSTGTAKVHVTAILKALGVRNRTAAVVCNPVDPALFARMPPYAASTGLATLRASRDKPKP